MVPDLQRMNNGIRLISNYPIDRVVYFVKTVKKSYPSLNIFAFDWQSNEKKHKDAKQLFN